MRARSSTARLRVNPQQRAREPASGCYHHHPMKPAAVHCTATGVRPLPGPRRATANVTGIDHWQPLRLSRSRHDWLVIAGTRRLTLTCTARFAGVPGDRLDRRGLAAGNVVGRASARRLSRGAESKDKSEGRGGRGRRSRSPPLRPEMPLARSSWAFEARSEHPQRRREQAEDPASEAGREFLRSAPGRPRKGKGDTMRRNEARTTLRGS